MSIAENINLLTQKFATNKDSLNEHQTALIDAFGGLNTVIYLCLSNPDSTKFVNEEKLNVLMNLVQSNAITHNHNDKNPHTHSNGSIMVEQEKHDCSSNKQLKDISDKCLELQVLPVTSPMHNTKNAIFRNLMDFYTHSMIIIADPYNNIYSKKCNLSSQHTQFILDKILFTTWFPACCSFLAMLLYVLSQVYWYLICDDYDGIYMFLIISSSLMGCCVSVSYMLSASINVCLLILQTFDFWFKAYNISLGIVSSYFLGIFRNDFHFVLFNMNLLLFIGTLFIFDAIFISSISKNILIIITVGILIYNAAHLYFNISDVYWDPFDSEYTRISVKSTTISSYINLALFVLKPIFGQIGRRCRQALLSSNSAVNTKLKQRSYYLHKRPIIQWEMDVNHSITQVEFSQSRVQSRSISIHEAM